MLPKGAIRIVFKKLRTSACIHCILHHRCTCPVSFSWQALVGHTSPGPPWNAVPALCCAALSTGSAPTTPPCMSCLLFCALVHTVAGSDQAELWFLFFFKGWGGRAVGGAYLTEYEFSLECELCYSWCVHCYGSIVSIMVLKNYKYKAWFTWILLFSC